MTGVKYPIPSHTFLTSPHTFSQVTSGMVLSDRHYGGVKYPVGGIGRIAETVAEGEWQGLRPG